MGKNVFLPLVVITLLLCGCEKVETEYQWVDLGLSVKWAKVNVGSSTISGYGDYYAWGEVSPKDCYTAENYKWYDNENHITKYCSNPRYQYADSLTQLLPEDDVAALEWGHGWRMPTYDELMELIKNCEWTFSSIDGVKGYMARSRLLGYENAWIFFPAAGFCDADDSYPGYEGYYWTSTNCGGSNSIQSDALTFNPSMITTIGYGDGMARIVGASIRPVHE
ncbi:MAG: hypothetical protein MJY74_06370 [Bacteroidaceae bacterium]|nr:hypothetical protein [Bacteroidaceae bacterium]